MTFILETHRLTLRPFQDADQEFFANYRSDPEIARYQSWNTPFTQTQATAFIQDMKGRQPGRVGEWYQLAIECKQTTGMIGDCAFHILKQDAQQAEIGFSLARQHQGQGYAVEAVGRLLDYLFGEMGLHRVTAICDANNHAAAKLLARIGMRQEGHFIENIWFKGSWGSEYSYAILKREWHSLRTPG